MLSFSLSLSVPSLFSGSRSVPSQVPLLLHTSSLRGWSVSLSCASRALYPSTRSFGSRSFTHSAVRAGSRFCISRVWEQWALKEGGAPHMERPLLSPQRSGQGRRGDRGRHSLCVSAAA